MKNLSAACFIVLAFAFSCFAKIMPVPLKESIRNSDLIVVGTLTDVSERKEDGTIYGKGKIVVEQFIAGNIMTANGSKLKTGDKLPLDYMEGFACVYGSHKRIENEKGIFLLTLDKNGEILYKDFRSLESLSEILNFLRKNVKSKTNSKKVKIHNETEQAPTLENPKQQKPEISFGVYSRERKINYHPIAALLVIFCSILLYYLLYRSRFKIR